LEQTQENFKLKANIIHKYMEVKTKKEVEMTKCFISKKFELMCNIRVKELLLPQKICVCVLLP
jgi:hypothetical protein